MDFEWNVRTRELIERVRAFMHAHVSPNEARHADEVRRGGWTPPPVVEELKREARAAGLWNLFLPDSDLGTGLTNLEYAPLCEEMGRVPWAAEVFNCSAPDTGNMEVLVRYGTPAQQAEWLRPLLDGEIRSCFTMTEPAMASSDATNIEASIERRGDDYVINGRKWWASGAGDPRCRIAIFLGRSNPDAARHARHSMILVPLDAPGVRIERLLTVFGYDDAPHGHAEITFDGVRVPATNMLLGEGRGFEIAQGRLGPGAFITACAPSDWPSGRSRRRALGSAAGSPSVGRSPNRVRCAPRSPIHGCRSSRRGCWCSKPRGSWTRWVTRRRARRSR